MRERRWLLLILYGILLTTAVSGALKASRPKFKIATTSTTTSTEEPPAEDNEGGDVEGTTSVSNEGNVTTGHTLTGIPQIDYIWDPNLPRELNGYNLSEYPFYNSMPEDIDFKCDGLHDGFYASVPHKCQVYHHCLYGTRYDFLCANFTAFDQKTFICHFVSEVDCVNSKKYWHRNDALYQAATTTTSSTTTTTTTTTLPPPTAAFQGRLPPRDRESGRRRRPFRRRPAYDYYEDYYDEEYDRGRPRGYDRREYDDYEERKYRRDRERDRDYRDFRDRDLARPRDPLRTREPDIPIRDEIPKDSEKTPRERFPARPNKRNPLMGGRDPVEEEPRSRTRDESLPRSKDIEDPELDDRRGLDFRTKDEENDRYSDKRFKDDYDDKDTPPGAAATNGNTEGLVKPAAPSSSVYARPRAPPKIRRPVPLGEQDRFAYKMTSTQPSVEDDRRRPVDPPLVNDYYDDGPEDIRPRRPLRRRPAIRERDRDFYETRDKDLDRPYRMRYRDEEDDVRLRKHPERLRDPYYDRERGLERGRDRSLDRGKDRTPERVAERERDRTNGRSQDSERPIQTRPLNREREIDRFKSRTKDPQESNEPTQRSIIYERTTTSTTSTTTTTTTPSPPAPIKEQSNYERPEAHQDNSKPSKYKSTHVTQEEESTTRDLPEKYWRPTQKSDLLEKEEVDEYDAEYYDEEEPHTPPPRTAVRIVKRPFLPSRGGNPNPRGLSPVGSKAPGGKNEARSETDYREEQKSKDSSEDKPQYNAYKVIRTDMLHKRPEEYETGTMGLNRRPEENLQRRTEEPVQRRPEKTVQRRPEDPVQRRTEEPIQRRPEEVIHRRPDEYNQRRPDQPMQRRPEDYQRRFEEQRRPEEQRRSEEHQSRSEESHQRRIEEHQRRPEEPSEEKATPNWSVDYQIQNTDQVVPTSSGSPFRNSVRVIPVTESPNHYYKENQDQPTGAGNYRAKQRLNEVTRLQDIPESEYDVTLNEALTPTLNQETNLPSGFVLPLHRQLGRDAILQSSENSYKFSRPIQQQQQPQQQQQQPQKSFLPSPPFVQPAPISRSNNERPKTVHYRTPETVHIAGNQYRQQRGPWHDYTGY